MPENRKSQFLPDAPQPSRRGVRGNIIALVVFLVVFAAGFLVSALQRSPHGIVSGMVVGLLLAQAPKIAQQWERAVILRLGKYRGLRGPGLFWIIPFFDSVTAWIDQRVITTNFNAEETLTSDTVPVNVDAVLFWMVYDPEKAALEVQNYALAVSWAAQTALRDIIGRTALTDLLRGREKIETELQQLIDVRTNPWGITVQSVEMRDVVIPNALQDAMSREAQAAREKQARIILGQAEVEIAHSFEQAAEAHRFDCAARHEHQRSLFLQTFVQNVHRPEVERGGIIMIRLGRFLEQVGDLHLRLPENDTCLFLAGRLRFP